MKINRWVLVGVGILISGLFLFLAFRNLHLQEIVAHIRSANPLWLLLGAGVYFIGVALISIRWQFLLRAIRPLPFSLLFPLVCVGYMGNNVYPFRSGEILRLVLLKREADVRLAAGATTAVIERIFDGLVMLTFIFVALLLVDVHSPAIQQVASVTAPLFLLALAVFFALAARPHWLRGLVAWGGRFLPAKLAHLVVRLADEVISGLEGLRSPAHLAGAVGFSYASWMVEASVYWLVSLAFGLGIGYPVALLVVGVVNLAGLIPASPGQLGVFEFFVLLVLGAVGVDEGQAKAYALVVHGVIWLPVTLVGLYFLLRFGLSVKALTHAEELERGAVV